MESSPRRDPASGLTRQILRLIRGGDVRKAFRNVEALQEELARLDPYLNEITRAGRKAVDADIRREPFGSARLEQLAYDLKALTVNCGSQHGWTLGRTASPPGSGHIARVL